MTLKWTLCHGATDQMTINPALCSRAEGQMTLIQPICTLQSLKMSSRFQAVDKFPNA